MFTSDKSIEDLQQLFAEVKKFLALQKQYTLLEVAEKLTILLSTLILILIVIILSVQFRTDYGNHYSAYYRCNLFPPHLDY